MWRPPRPPLELKLGKVYMLSRNRREASDKPNVSFPKCVKHVMLGPVWMVFSSRNKPFTVSLQQPHPLRLVQESSKRSQRALRDGTRAQRGRLTRCVICGTEGLDSVLVESLFHQLIRPFFLRKHEHPFQAPKYPFPRTVTSL